jgi:hypothetical protein
MAVGRTNLVTGLVLAVLACASPGLATTFVLMSEQDLAARSVAAVTGSVTDIEAAADPATDGVNTYVHIDPDEVVFGTLPAGPLVLREIGGHVAGRSEWVFGSAEYQVGEAVLVFLSQNADGTLRTTAMSMGKFTLKADAHGALTALRHLGEGAALWNLQRGELEPNPAPEDYDLPGLLDAVRRATPPAGAHALTRRPAIAMTPPELERASVREHQESFTYLSSPSRWFEPDDAQPIPFLIDAAGDVGLGGATSRAAVNDAFAAWTNVPTSDLTLTDGGTLAQPIAFAGCDGGNRVVFNDPFDEITDPSGCGGVLAIGGYCASSETRTVNGTSFRRIRVGKVMFNNGWSQCPGWNRCNLSEVATHELGHTLGFGHSTDTNATMYASAHFDGRCASLRSDDLAAINFVYPSLASPTPSPSPTPRPPTATVTVAKTPTSTSAPTVPTPTRSATPTATAASTSTATAGSTSTAPAAPTNTPTATVRHKVRGRVQYYSSDRAVPNVTITLHGQSDDATQTSSLGDYEFGDVPSGSWELAADKTSDFGSGVTPLDAAYVLQAVAHLRTLDSTQTLACDTTGDGQLSALDAARILQFSVGMTGRLPVAEACGSDWAFVPDPDPMQQQSVVNPTVGGGVCHDGKIMLADLLDEAPNQNFRAILFGDCTGNWDATQSAGVERAVATSFRAPRVRIGDPIMHGSDVHLPVYVRSAAPYNSLDLQVSYDPARLTPKLDGITFQHPGDDGITSANAPQPGVLRVAMASGQPIMRRFGALLMVEFTLADGMSDPGTLQALQASVDELPAKIAGNVAAVRRRR